MRAASSSFIKERLEKFDEGMDVRRLGTLGYQEAPRRCRSSSSSSARQRLIADQLLLLEHPAVITLGVKTRNDLSHVLATPRGARGGRASACSRRAVAATSPITVPGSSSAIRSSICKPDRCDVHRYVRDLEEVLIRAVAAFGIAAGTRRRA